MRINQIFNSAMSIARTISMHDGAIGKAIERISTGLRINRAADDPAGLAMREKMRAQIRGLQQASRNAQDSISMLQTAEGALNETHSMLQRMRELAVQAANETLTPQDRLEIQKEIDQLTQEVDRIAKTTEFNTKPLLRGGIVLSGNTLTGGDASNQAFGKISFLNQVGIGNTVSIGGEDYVFGDGTGGTVAIGGTLASSLANLAQAVNDRDSANVSASVSGDNLIIRAAGTGAAGNQIALAYTLSGNILNLNMQVGANAGQSMGIQIGNMDSGALRVGLASDGSLISAGNDAAKGLDVTSTAAANLAITRYEDAIARVASERAGLGASQNRLEHTINYLDNAAENLSASESRISDADIAQEAANLAKAQILMQASTAMMAQANKIRSDAVLRLLGA